ALNRSGMPEELVIGLGDPRARLGDSAASCREALAALDVGVRLRMHRSVVAYRGLMPEVLIAANPLTARNIVASALGPLLSHDSLLETLTTYLDSGLSTRSTASRLHVHENTVAYRLRRITELLHLSSPAQLARLDILMANRALALMPDLRSDAETVET
ncbi:MAG: PucR family transcriptional regulator, partial [Nocardioidaceae bacterium]